MRTGLLLSSLLVATLGTGCASMFMNGGKLVDADYKPIPSATYIAPVCTKVSTNVVGKGSKATYQLVQEQGQPALFEASEGGGGSVITNRWTDTDGDHYFGWVTSGNVINRKTSGWEYVVPTQGAPGTRRVFNDVQMAKGADGVTKPTSKESFTCPLLPS